jgi:hypothetical protein
MLRRAGKDTWDQFVKRLPPGRELYQTLVPTDLTYHGVVQGNFDYVPPNSLLAALRMWLEERGEEEVLYFLTETVGSEAGDFVVSLSSLTEEELAEVNRGRESAFSGIRGDWALFMDHEGRLHVAGPSDLFDTLRAVV